MAQKKTLQRLWRLREMEEEQSRLQLERLVTDRNRLQGRLESALSRKLRVRQDFITSVQGSDRPGRSGAAIEMKLAGEKAAALVPLLKAAERELVRGRDAYLQRRTQRRQVETLLVNARRAAETELGRRTQQILDDWYGRKAQIPRASADTPASWEAAAAVDNEGEVAGEQK